MLPDKVYRLLEERIDGFEKVEARKKDKDQIKKVQKIVEKLVEKKKPREELLATLWEGKARGTTYIALIAVTDREDVADALTSLLQSVLDEFERLSKGGTEALYTVS